jgi:hypothetical protein
MRLRSAKVAAIASSVMSTPHQLSMAATWTLQWRKKQSAFQFTCKANARNHAVLPAVVLGWVVPKSCNLIFSRPISEQADAIASRKTVRP